MRIATVTFGCRLNRAETDEFERSMVAQGHEIVDAKAAPDAIVVRGCSVTAKAQKDSELAIAKLKREHPSARIIVTGCLPEASATFFSRRGAEQAEPQSIGDRTKSTTTTKSLCSLWTLCETGSQSLCVSTCSASLREKKGSPAEPDLRSSRAFLKIQDGCDCKCAYCIVPKFRGASRSVPLEEVLSTADRMLREGFCEIVATGCNAMEYRSGGVDFPGLVSRLCDTAEGRGRIRLGSVEPSPNAVVLAGLFGERRNLCPFLHLSLQSASPSILAAMRRPYRIEHLEAVSGAFRAAAGDLATLGADVICGFPGETEEDFAATRAFLERWNFTNLHAFPYSERPGTPAATMPGAIPPPERRRRAKILSEDAARRRERQILAMAGRMVEVCVEKPGDEFSEGWTGEYLRAKIPGFRPRRSLQACTFMPA